MTTMAERWGPAVYTAAGTRPDCPATRHGASQHAWRRFRCRCPEAVAAHEAYLRRDNEIRWARKNGKPVGDCSSKTHRPTVKNYRDGGCRCPATVATWQRERGRQNARAEAERQRHEATIQRAADEWANWRRVSTITVDLMVAGFPENPTRAERMVAVMWMLRLGYWDGPDIATRLHIEETEVDTARADPGRLRRRRTERRLAEVKAKALRNAYLAEKKTAGQAQSIS